MILKLIGLILFLSVANGAAQAKEVELRFRPFVKVTGETDIRLLHLVEVSNLSPKTQELLGKIRVADAPKLGEELAFAAEYISQIVRRHLDQSKFSVRIPSKLRVVHQGLELSEEVLREEMKRHWQALCKECRLEISTIRPPAIPLTLKGRPWRLNLQAQLPKGSFTERLIVETSDGKEATFWVNGQLRIQKLVPVTNRALSANSKVFTEDFRMEWRDVTFATDGTPSAEQLGGQQTRMAIAADQIIWMNAVAKEKVVKRGDLVRVTVGDSDWQVVLMAVTEQDGSVGDRVNVKNSQTQKIITGEVVGPGQVVVR
jgi:flagella basal body P-ring formation protein FlgA